jgi:predicted SAM-dependent methyltransferase/ADP-heptose:LPS heptosyltransferase
MVWRPEDPQGNESAKVRWDLVPYVRGRGIDIGCGPAKALPHMIGVDVHRFSNGSPDVVADCRKLEFFSPESLDFVFSSHVLEHMEDPGAVLRHWLSLVKPGGHLVLYLPHRDFYPRMGQPGANPDHKSDFHPSDVVALMREAAPDWDLVDNEERNLGMEYSFLQAYRKREAGAGQLESWMNPKPTKTACVVRYGGLGDALWASSILPALKAEGYHVTVCTEHGGAMVLANDPHIDRFVIQDSGMIAGSEMLAYWMWMARKYDRFVNLVGAVETRLLPAPSDGGFHWPDRVRHLFMNQNYLEAYHDFAGVPHKFRQKFYPTEAELEEARSVRAAAGGGPMVILAPSGSSCVKWYPHTQRFLDMAAGKGWITFVLGDIRDAKFDAPPGRIIGLDLPIRRALALAMVADVVVGCESVFTNASAFEEQLTICLLGHSTDENLTKHWINSVAIEPQGLDCYPCHRIHLTPHFCTIDEGTKAAACHAAARPDLIIGLIDQYLSAPVVAELAEVR